MTTQDDDFIKRLRATFKVEAEEHLQAISLNLIELEKLSSWESATDAVEMIYREAHSLKGAARAVDLQSVESICQAIEGLFSAWKRKELTPSREAFDLLHRSLDAIRPLIEFLDTAQTATAQQIRDELIRQLNRLQTRPSQSPLPLKADKPPVATAVPSATSVLTPPTEPEKGVITDTVRISIDKLDACLLQAEDMLTIKAMVAQRSSELHTMASMFSQWQQEWNKISDDVRDVRQAIERQSRDTAAMPSIAASTALANFLDWNAEYVRLLENRIVSLAAQGEQDRYSVARRVDELLEDAKKLLMLPFSTLAQVFPKLVRDLSREQNKDVELVIKGAEVEIDKRILEEMKDAMIHIIRNAIDHGIEVPTERQRLNKPPRATVSIQVSPVNGNKVEILISDDGAGVDVERVKTSAVKQQIISEAESKSLRETEALSLVFHSEVSTSPTVTAISGRGLGMAIVRAKAEKLGGRVSIESRRHEGTTLRIVLPLTLATFRGILVVASGQIFVVPLMNVERVLRVKPDEIRTVENRETISVHGSPVSLARLDAVLQLPPPSRVPDPSEPLPVILVQAADQRIAFAVEEVLREEEVLVKPLRKPLVRIRNIAGATVLGSGMTVPILNATDLMKSARTFGVPPAAVDIQAAEPARRAKRILVVEDSITSRMLLKGILESAGYQVKVAVDGVDAFAALREHPFDLVVSDVEMPRMNGFDLTSKIRSDRRFGGLPVVLVTALETREQREQGIDAGANAYVVKSRFDQSNLLEVVSRLI